MLNNTLCEAFYTYLYTKQYNFLDNKIIIYKLTSIVPKKCTTFLRYFICTKQNYFLTNKIKFYNFVAIYFRNSFEATTMTKGSNQ